MRYTPLLCLFFLCVAVPCVAAPCVAAPCVAESPTPVLAPPPTSPVTSPVTSPLTSPVTSPLTPLAAGLDPVDSQCLQQAYGLPADHWAAALSDPSLAESMAEVYPLEAHRPPGARRPELSPGMQPGRVRSYVLLRALYGQNRAEVQGRLVGVAFFNEKILLSPMPAQALAKVAHRLEEAVRHNPALLPYILPTSGGYAWRHIAGENRLSPHSFGIAVDMNPNNAPYWRWSAAGLAGKGHPAQQSYPREIVSAFEAEGFIWGGKWHKYDIMHFEYRPELICKARLVHEQARAVHSAAEPSAEAQPAESPADRSLAPAHGPAGEPAP